MKLACPIVRDLLPLYAENLASAESRDAVETHLQDCPACRKLLATKTPRLPGISSTLPMIRMAIMKDFPHRRLQMLTESRASTSL